MKTLLSSCAHGSNIFITLELDDTGKPTFVCKSSSGSGIPYLHRELAGIKWYNERSKNRIGFRIERDEINYFLAKFDFIEGEMRSLKRGVQGNKDYIFSGLRHYADIWGEYAPKGNGPLHGDYSLGNLIFVNSEPIVVDWEHFHMEGIPIGFDALFLIYEALWFESGNHLPKKSTLDLVARMISLLIERKCLNSSLLISPLKSMREFIEDNRGLWGTQSKKLPVLLFQENIVNFVDEKVNTKIC